jgi:hypothetical protein
VEAGSFTDSEIIVMLGENGMLIAIVNFVPISFRYRYFNNIL